MTELLIRLMNLPRRTQQAVAIGMLAFAAILAVWLITLAGDHLSAQAEEITDKRIELGRLDALLAKVSADNAAPQTAGANKEALYLPGDTLAVARARFQERINAMAAQSGAVVISINTVPDAAPDGVPLIGAVTDIQGSLSAVHALLLQIETSTPPLVVRKASIRNTTMLQQGTLQGPLELAARLEIYGSGDPVLTPSKSVATK